MAYNTTPFHGKKVRVEKSGTSMDYSLGWSLDVVLDMSDASRVGQDWKESLPAQAGWSGSCEVYFVAGNTQQKAYFDNLVTTAPGTKLTATKFLLDGSTNAFTGNIFITGFSQPATMGDIVHSTFTFTGSAALTITDGA